jgi:hypothetical protein
MDSEADTCYIGIKCCSETANSMLVGICVAGSSMPRGRFNGRFDSFLSLRKTLSPKYACLEACHVLHDFQMVVPD